MLETLGSFPAVQLLLLLLLLLLLRTLYTRISRPLVGSELKGCIEEATSGMQMDSPSGLLTESPEDQGLLGEQGLVVCGCCCCCCCKACRCPEPPAPPLALVW